MNMMPPIVNPAPRPMMEFESKVPNAEGTTNINPATMKKDAASQGGLFEGLFIDPSASGNCLDVHRTGSACVTTDDSLQIRQRRHDPVSNIPNIRNHVRSGPGWRWTHADRTRRRPGPILHGVGAEIVGRPIGESALQNPAAWERMTLCVGAEDVRPWNSEDLHENTRAIEPFEKSNSVRFN